jgi:hypothetical protein
MDSRSWAIDSGSWTLDSKSWTTLGWRYRCDHNYQLNCFNYFWRIWTRFRSSNRTILFSVPLGMSCKFCIVGWGSKWMGMPWESRNQQVRESWFWRLSPSMERESREDGWGAREMGRWKKGGGLVPHAVPPSPVTHLLCRSEVQYRISIE